MLDCSACGGTGLGVIDSYRCAYCSGQGQMKKAAKDYEDYIDEDLSDDL
jgi:RecJ-like exonuclease